ncbi:hypothetical protein ES703_20008 [subsurface metagenome]
MVALRILVAYTHRDLFEEVGAKNRIDKLVKLLLCHNEITFLCPESIGKNSFEQDRGIQSVHSFREWFALGKSLGFFTDLNISFLLRLKKASKRQKIDLILISFPWGVFSASLLNLNIPIIYDSHGVESDAVRVRFDGYPIIAKQLLQSYLRLVERLACKRASHIIAISELDRQRLISKYGISGSKVTAIPVWVDFNKSQEDIQGDQAERDATKLVVVFHGSYGHKPNREAFELICNYIAPEVEKRNSKIQFLIAGTGLPPFEKGNVKSLGFVDNLSALLKSSDIAIVPVLKGTGVRIKIFDYMATGLPIITTRKGIEGIDAESGQHAVILNAVDEGFILAILDLANDKGQRQRLGRNAMELIGRCYSREKIQAKLDEILAKLKAK